MMANDMLIKVSFLLNMILLTLNTSKQIPCFENNNTLLETAGDAILTVFVDANYGQYCNVSSSKGSQQILTVLHVVRTLNKYNHIPGVKLGLRIFDTCHDRISVFRQVLRVAVQQSYTPDYEMGVLMPSQYRSMMNYLHDHGLPIGIYEERNFTMSMIDILAHYLSTKYNIIDLVYTSADSVLDHFLEVTEDAGVCVKRSDRRVNGDRYANVMETVIVAIGERDDVLRWLEENEKSRDSRETWLLLPFDNSDISDLIPSGSYVIKPEIPCFDLDEFSNVGKFLDNSNNLANHSPYLLDIGKAVIKLVEVFQNYRKRSCPIDEENIISDSVTQSLESQTSESQRETHDLDVYELLHVQPESYSVRYVVAMKTRHELINVALYEIEVSKLRILPKNMTSGMPELCLEHLAENCKNCTNFRGRDESKMDVLGKNILKNSIYVPIFLIVIICGTLVCCVMVIFIVYRFVTKEILDGNPALTIVLVLANLFILLTALPFCVTDNYFGAENLNAWKIFLTTLAFGLTFSIMLSRTLFLALSTGGVFIIHINGYLQSFMTLFAYGVQIAMSVMYFILSTMNSAVVARSLIFIALLGYNIFLLIALFVACYFIIRMHNYYEEKYFLGTVIGLVIIWMIWLICFMLMQPENRDAIVLFGTVATAYLIIFGILIPKIYYMITHISRRIDPEQRFNPVNLLTTHDSTINTVIRQSRSSHNCYPRESQILQTPYPNYYDNLSLKYFERCRNLNHHETPIYNNYKYYAEMKEIDAAYVPQKYVENTEFLANNVIYAQPKIYKSQRIILEKKSNAETTCNRDNSSPIPNRLHIEMYPIRHNSPTHMVRERRINEEEEKNEEEKEDEMDQEDKSASRITRL